MISFCCFFFGGGGGGRGAGEDKNKKMMTSSRLIKKYLRWINTIMCVIVVFRTLSLFDFECDNQQTNKNCITLYEYHVKCLEEVTSLVNGAKLLVHIHST